MVDEMQSKVPGSEALSQAFSINRAVLEYLNGINYIMPMGKLMFSKAK